MMTPRSLAALVLALCACATVPAAHRITLKPRVVLGGGKIVLGDVAEFSPGAPAALARLPLGGTPWPGQTRHIALALVKVRMLSAGFDLNQYAFSGTDGCTVSVKTQRVAAAAVVAAARRELLSRFPAEWSNGTDAGGPEVRLELARAVADVAVPAGMEPVEIRAAVPKTAVPVGAVTVDVEVRRGGVRLKHVPVHFTVRLFDRVAVAQRRIEAGEPFSPANVVFARREVTRAPRALVRGWEDLRGRVAAADIGVAESIRRDRLRRAEKPFVIERNQRVRLVVETPTLRAATLGRALARARAGEVARARNLATGREVVGVATAKGAIQVLGGEPIHARLGRAKP